MLLIAGWVVASLPSIGLLHAQRGTHDQGRTFDLLTAGVSDIKRMVRQRLIDLMDRYRVDALVYPVKSLSAPMLGNSDDGPRDNSISAVTGLPAIVLPAGMNEEGLPLALELLGRPFSEPKLIQLAYAYEKASRARVAPKSTPHLPGEVFWY